MKQRTQDFFLTGILATLMLGWCSIVAHGAVSVWAPRIAHPVFGEAGDTFIAEIKGDQGLSNDGWTAQISNDLRSWACTVNSATYTTVNRDTENGYELQIQLPADAPPELFALKVSSARVARPKLRSLSAWSTISMTIFTCCTLPMSISKARPPQNRTGTAVPR